MISRTGLTFIVCFAVILVHTNITLAGGGTRSIATAGREAYVAPDSAEGVADLVNDESRTSGWNSWFTEWPNDVNHYAYEIESTEDLNRLISKLAAIQTDLRQIRLSYRKEPTGLGFMTKLPGDNGIPVMFSLGHQPTIDQWFERTRKPFGVLEFTGTPVAVPPTLTLFVQNEAIDLQKLKIPDGISITIGYVPTLFHDSKTTLEEAIKSEDAQSLEDQKLKMMKQNLDEPGLVALEKIEAYLKARKDKAN